MSGDMSSCMLARGISAVNGCTSPQQVLYLGEKIVYTYYNITNNSESLP